jgi:hypothetical protein
LYCLFVSTNSYLFSHVFSLIHLFSAFITISLPLLHSSDYQPLQSFVYTENHTKHINTLCGQKQSYCVLKYVCMCVAATYSYHCLRKESAPSNTRFWGRNWHFPGLHQLTPGVAERENGYDPYFKFIQDLRFSRDE